MDEYREYMKAEISEIKTDVKDIQTRLRGIEVALAEMRTEARIKIAFYGTMGGLLPAIGVLIYFLL